jgi:two-component system, response regulator YesN
MILTYLIRYFRDDNKTNSKQASKRMQLIMIEEAISYINKNFDRTLRLDEVAKELYLTPQYLSSFFKRVVGVNFLDYVNNIRVYHAIKLLQETDRKITHIAMECGFNNTATFNSIFKKFTGKTSSEYRL